MHHTVISFDNLTYQCMFNYWAGTSACLLTAATDNQFWGQEYSLLANLPSCAHRYKGTQTTCLLFPNMVPTPCSRAFWTMTIEGKGHILHDTRGEDNVQRSYDSFPSDRPSHCVLRHLFYYLTKTHLGDASTHEATADHSDILYCVGHGCSLGKWPPGEMSEESHDRSADRPSGVTRHCWMMFGTELVRLHFSISQVQSSFSIASVLFLWIILL